MKHFLSLLLSLCLLGALCACGGAKPASDPLTVVTVSDIHYTGEQDYDYTGTYKAVCESNGSGKQMELLSTLFAAFSREMAERRPDYILVTGDLTLNGAKLSHEALAEALHALQAQGPQVLVLPGNHDQGARAYTFPGGEPEGVESLTAEEFAAVYADFGYAAARSRDAASLSYVCDTGRGTWFFMLDTRFRASSSLTRLSDDTMEWLARELAACKAAGARAVVAGHHNLLVHHPMFQFSYVLDNAAELEALMRKYDAELYLCGHLHPQSIAEDEFVTDIATGSFAVFPHRYGLLSLDAEGWRYEAEALDVEGYADALGSADERLLHYGEWGRQFFYDCLYRQSMNNLAESVEDETLRGSIAALSAELNANYFAGTPSRSDSAALQALLPSLPSGFLESYLLSITELPDSLSAASK